MQHWNLVFPGLSYFHGMFYFLILVSFSSYHLKLERPRAWMQRNDLKISKLIITFSFFFQWSLMIPISCYFRIRFVSTCQVSSWMPDSAEVIGSSMERLCSTRRFLRVALLSYGCPYVSRHGNALLGYQYATSLELKRDTVAKCL